MRRGVRPGNEDVLFGMAPYGWRVSRDRRTLVADAYEQRVLAVVRHMRSEGFSIRAIIDELAIAGYFNRRGRPFSVATVFKMLREPSLPAEALPRSRRRAR
jgi:hypothetical protein